MSVWQRMGIHHAPIETTLHKKKDHSGYEVKSATIDLTLCPQASYTHNKEVNLHANCWVKDVDGRELFIKMPHDLLLAIQNMMNDAEQQLLKGGYTVAPSSQDYIKVQ